MFALKEIMLPFGETRLIAMKKFKFGSLRATDKMLMKALRIIGKNVKVLLR